MNLLEHILNTYTQFFVTTTKRTLTADEANRFIINARNRGITDSYLHKIVRVVTTDGNIPLKELI
jgi:hypothetical protein